MKNKILLAVLIGILIIPFVSSAIELNKDSYQLKETVIAKLAFTYAPDKISTEHVNILDDEGKKILIPFFIVKFSDNLYYVYFTLPNAFINNNYTLQIGPYYYNLGGALQRTVENADIKLFSDRNIPVIAVDPGAAVIDLNTQDYFYVNIKNNGDVKADLEMHFSGGTLNYNEYGISPGDTLKLKGTVDSAGEKLVTINYNGLTYNIPILVKPKTGITAPVTATEAMPSDAIKFIDTPNEIKVSILNGQVLTGSINFKNFWTNDIKDVKLSLTDNLGEVLTLYQTSFDVVKPNQAVSVSIDINSNKNLKKDYSGDIKLTSGELSLSYPVSIIYIPVESKQEEAQPISEAQIQNVETEKQEIQKQNELKIRFFISLITILFVLFIVILIVLRSRRKKPKDFIFSSRR